MRGGMAGSGVDEKENTPVRGTEKKGKERRRSSAGSGRRLSISGSKPRLHYLRVTNRFQRKGGFGRGRITAHRPVQFDGSPYEFSLRSDSEGDKRKSFVVFEDDMDSMSSKSRQLECATDSKSTGKFKNATGENCSTPKPQGTEEQLAPRTLPLQGSINHVLENFVAFRARNKSMFSAKLRSRSAAPLLGSINQQESGSRPSLKILAAKWQRGGRRSLFTQRSLDTSEFDDLEQTFRKMDEEDLEREMQERNLEREMQERNLEREMQEMNLEREMQKYNLEREMHKYDLENVMQPRSQTENEEPFVSVEASESHETVMVPVEEQANVGELAPEPFNSRECELLSPRNGGLETEDEAANIDLTTPLPNDPKGKLRLDHEVPFPEATPVILELGVSPEASETDRVINQLTPPAIKQPTPPTSPPFSGCNNQDSDTLQQIPVEVESEIAQTVEAVQVWSVELDPSRRRRETMQCHSNRRSPWIKTLVLSSFQPVHQSPDTTADDVLRTAAMSMDHFDRVTPLTVCSSLPRLRSSDIVLHGPAKNLAESYEGGFLSTNLPSTSGKDQNEKDGDIGITDSVFPACPDHATTNEFEAHVPLTENGQDMQALKDGETTPSNSRSSWPDGNPAPPIDLSAQCMGSFHEKVSETSLEPPSSQSAELLRRVDDVTATPSFVQALFDRPTISPTPPRNLSLFFGNPFGQMSGEELSRRWLQFCATPPIFSDATAAKKKSWNVESAFAEPTCSDATTSFPSEQVLQRSTEADVLPIAEEEAVSSDGLDRKTSTHDEDLLPSAEETLSSDGSDGVMDYENDFDDISNDTTCIVQTGASSADNDQEGTSALKECPQEDAQDALFGEDMRCMNLTPLRDNNFVEATAGPPVEYSLTHIDEDPIDQFMNSLQVTPGMDDSCAERLTSNAEDVSRDSTLNHNCQSPGHEAGPLNVCKELITPGSDEDKLSGQPQDECTPVQQKPKTKRTRKSTRIKKVDSPLDAGSKWSNGQRVSTRIKSKPLDWWRGERMLYGRVHSTLNTLIGIKHLSPDPVWPRPRDRKNKVEPPKFKVDSFVSDEHKELLRLAAQ
ncbi:hypothetical protein M758_9G164300 [Ceratodon purpureus]|nr:hypothetical protein M758_9G164300 [Ceratodon purpureus]